MSQRKKKLPPNPSRLIEGLRDTGYDFNTALADIVDNSIDAEATQIDIRIQMDDDGDVEVRVADNGTGMDADGLLEGMTYGATGRPDPKRLGKFGLGLKTASTAFCRRLSVASRRSGVAPLAKATWDLDHVADAGEWELLIDDASQEEVRSLDEIAPGHAGTLVVWQQVDRLLKKFQNPGGAPARTALKKVVDSFRSHAGMVYQRFLDPADERARNIQMSINSSPVEAWDPFCAGSGGKVVASETREAELSDGSTASFTIRAFVLPRKEEFASEEAWRKARLSNRWQGIYIYRENRLIHPADWLGMFNKEPHGTLLRVEFSFDHELDAAFQVDIKKARIVLNDDLFDWVQNQFLPAPRNAADQHYRKGERKKVSDGAKSVHAGSNSSIGSKEADLQLAKVSITDQAKNEVEIVNKRGSVRLKLRLTAAGVNGQVSVQPTDGIDDGMLWEPALIAGHHAVRVNTGHPYYTKVYVPNYASGVTIQGMDALLWALCEAELGTVSEATKNHFQELRFEVSRLLRKLVEDLPDPGGESED